jgi:hypothetical protein
MALSVIIILRPPFTFLIAGPLACQIFSWLVPTPPADIALTSTIDLKWQRE